MAIVNRRYPRQRAAAQIRHLHRRRLARKNCQPVPLRVHRQVNQDINLILDGIASAAESSSNVSMFRHARAAGEFAWKPSLLFATLDSKIWNCEGSRFARMGTCSAQPRDSAGPATHSRSAVSDWDRDHSCAEQWTSPRAGRITRRTAGPEQEYRQRQIADHSASPRWPAQLTLSSGASSSIARSLAAIDSSCLAISSRSIGQVRRHNRVGIRAIDRLRRVPSPPRPTGPRYAEQCRDCCALAHFPAEVSARFDMPRSPPHSDPAIAAACRGR